MNGSKKISAQLTREQFLFLADFEEQCDDPGISKASILRCLLRLFEDVGVDVRRVRTEDELLKQSLKALKGSRP